MLGTELGEDRECTTMTRLQKDMACLLAMGDVLTLRQLVRVLSAVASVMREDETETKDLPSFSGERRESIAQYADQSCRDSDEWRALMALGLMQDGMAQDQVALRLGLTEREFDTTRVYGKIMKRFHAQDSRRFLAWLSA